MDQNQELAKEYFPTLDEIRQSVEDSRLLLAKLDAIVKYGQVRLEVNMMNWKHRDKKPSFVVANNKPPYPYGDKDLYMSASNNLWYLVAWQREPALDEIYYKALLGTANMFMQKEEFLFNRGIVYANMGVAQATQMKIDEGFANILKALIEDSIYLEGTPEDNVFKRKLLTQFEDVYVKNTFQMILVKLNIVEIPKAKDAVDALFDTLGSHQRIFLDYTFSRMMQNQAIWHDKPNSFTANRLLAYAQDFCLFCEDFLKSKFSTSKLSSIMNKRNRNYVLLSDLIAEAFPSVDMTRCGADTMDDLDDVLEAELEKQAEPETCLRVLLTLRNYSSHNIGGESWNYIFYRRYDRILDELVRAMWHIHRADVN